MKCPKLKRLSSRSRNENKENGKISKDVPLQWNPSHRSYYKTSLVEFSNLMKPI